jgi:spoIIIJ-associated protein
VTVLRQPEEGFLGVGGSDALVEVRLLFDDPRPGAGESWATEDEEDDADGPTGNVRSPDDLDFDDELDELPSDEPDDEEIIPEAGSSRLREFLQMVLQAMGVDAKVRIIEEVDVLKAEIVAEDLGVFIGRRGQTIDAVEYLASLALYPRPESRKRVEIDAAGYKERRRQNIERVALHGAQEAARRRKPVELEAMTSAERKIVHLTLKERRDVTTESRGREPNRAVVILPSR